jgi:acyl-CoA thioester hydrolase
MPTTVDLSGEIDWEPAFHDCDPMGVVWHGHYFKYLEHARCALLRRFDYDYPQMQASGWLWPVVDARIKYVRPLRYGQRLKIRAEIVEWEHRLRFNYRIRDAADNTKFTSASTVLVAVDPVSGQMQYVCPSVLWEKLGVQPAS